MVLATGNWAGNFVAADPDGSTVFFQVYNRIFDDRHNAPFSFVIYRH